MNKNLQFIFALFIIFSLTNCKKASIEKKYWVISAEDSIAKSNNKYILPPKPSGPYKWYTDVVFIFDSKSKVFIYQTEKKYNSNFSNDSFLEESEYPNFLELKPEYLISIDSKDFINFIKNNDDIFGLIPNENKPFKGLCIVSESDTIKNQALYDFVNFIYKPKCRIAYHIRRTTEEEDSVLIYKRNQKEYIPESIKWSKNFLTGKYKPLTKEYKNLESKVWILRKANPTFRKNSLETPLTL
jgi:hypothetical protein